MAHHDKHESELPGGDDGVSDVTDVKSVPADDAETDEEPSHVHIQRLPAE